MTKHKLFAATAASAALAVGVEVATYPRWRQWCLQWGATADEVARFLPGDELLTDPHIVTTRAIGIVAPTSGERLAKES